MTFEVAGSVGASRDRTGAIREKLMSPPGELKNISPRMEAMRLKYAIPDKAFNQACAVYDRCLLWQIEAWEQGQETFGDTSIIMPDNTKKAQAEASSRAVIIDVGLAALDSFRDNGGEVGDVVWFLRLSPYRIPVAWIGGAALHVVLCRAGDFIANESLQERLEAGQVKMVLGEDGQHILVKADGSKLTPSMPRIPADY